MKNKKKLIALGIAALILASVAVCFSACTKDETSAPAEAVSDTVSAETEEAVPETEETVTEEESDESVTETTKEETTEKAEDHMAAYNEFLKNYNGGEYGPGFRFELVYLTDDSIPELFVAKDEFHSAPVEIYTYSDGDVIKLHDQDGSYGTIKYVERESLIVRDDYRKGYDVMEVKKINADGTVEDVFSCFDNVYYAEQNDEEAVYNVNDEFVSEEEYNKAKSENIPENISEFAEGIPMTDENIDKYCS